MLLLGAGDDGFDRHGDGDFTGPIEDQVQLKLGSLLQRGREIGQHDVKAARRECNLTTGRNDDTGYPGHRRDVVVHNMAVDLGPAGTGGGDGAEAVGLRTIVPQGKVNGTCPCPGQGRASEGVRDRDARRLCHPRNGNDRREGKDQGEQDLNESSQPHCGKPICCFKRCLPRHWGGLMSTQT